MKTSLLKTIGIIFFLFLGLNNTNAQYNGAYIGGKMWFGGPATYNTFKSSGFNEVILWAIHVDPGNGDLYLNLPEPWLRVNLFQDGAWVSTADNEEFLVNLASFKEGTTSVTRMTWSIGTSFDDDFQSIETLIDAQGTGTSSILYRNFKALKEKMPFIDALDYDDERNFDEPSMTQFSVMVADLGFKVTFSPFHLQNFWKSVYDNVESQRPGTIDCIHLQAYAGGSGNNPGSWNALFSGLEVSPGLQGPSRSAASVASLMNSWESNHGIAGGFMWVWDDIEDGTSPNSVADYAAAIQPVVNTSTTPDGSTNIAPDATITVSSEYVDPNWSKEKLTDGIIGQNGNGEWASNGEATPWAQLTWGSSVTADKVVLYDRPNTIENIGAGTLTFSDGSSINVSALPNNGAAKEVTFAEKTISWVRFTVTNGVGPNNGLSEFQVFKGSGTPTPSQTPFGGTAWAIPGVVESENFDIGGQDVAYNDSNPSSNTGGQYRTDEGVDIAVANEGGHQIGWTVAGEWQEYTVNVASAGTYNAAIRYAANAGNTGAIRLEFNGSDKTGSINLPVTGGWQTFQTVNKSLTLSAGEQVLRVYTVTAGINLNKITFTSTGGSTPVAVTLGNGITSDGIRDGWRSNMFVNESDTYTNTSGSSQQIKLTEFNFYAYRDADPLTPFVVKVNGNNNFTVLAVGTTRTNTSYNAGQNNLAFNNGTPTTITLNNGETLATGYIDANANGSGGSAGSVIPFDQNAGADELWYTGGPNSNQAGSVTVGAAPVAGANTLNLNRNYRYNFKFEVTNGSGARKVNLIGEELTNTTKEFKVYPNPFNNQIRVSIPTNKGFKSAKIYTLAGQLIVSKALPEGQKSVKFDFGNGIQRGVFLLKLESENEIMTYKLIRN